MYTISIHIQYPIPSLPFQLRQSFIETGTVGPRICCVKSEAFFVGAWHTSIFPVAPAANLTVLEKDSGSLASRTSRRCFLPVVWKG